MKLTLMSKTLVNLLPWKGCEAETVVKMELDLDLDMILPVVYNKDCCREVTHVFCTHAFNFLINMKTCTK